MDAGFLAGGRLLVSETNSNDGVYTIAQVTPDTITLTAGDALTSETVASGARLKKPNARGVKKRNARAMPRARYQP